jgi:hypothetical protein
VEKRSTRYNDNTKDFEFMKRWSLIAESIIAEGKINVHFPKVEKGLIGVLEGMDLMKDGRVSGSKLVYTL